MSNDPLVLSSLTAAVSVLGNEYLKGIATDAGKNTWSAIKSLFAWTSDPSPTEIAEKVANAVATSPEMIGKLLQLLKSSQAGAATSLVEKLEVNGGKVVLAGTINDLRM
jgi:hypothetical protein